MKVYVINVESETERLQQFSKNYPSCLPKYSVWKAKTGADVDTPDWWQSSANRWALVQNFIDILSTDTDEDILIFEDDCTFAEDFEEKYNAFLNEVPDDWDMLYLGAQHVYYPTQVSDGVLQLKDSICGHAIIYRNSIKQLLVDYYQEPNWGCKHMPDQRRAQAMASGKFKAYSPTVNICGQSAGYSILSNKDRHARWYNTFKYISLDNYLVQLKNGKLNTLCEPVEPIQECIDKDICSVSVYGDNIFYLLGFLLKQQELNTQLGLPIVCHIDQTNKELLDAIVQQESIDVSHINFVVHEDTSRDKAQIWRMIPVGASTMHIFDVDNKLHSLHVEAVQDFIASESNYNCYVCKYIPKEYGILGGASGYRKNLLEQVFSYFNKQNLARYGTDEKLITGYLIKNEIPCLVYSMEGSKHKTPSWSIKNLNGKVDYGKYTDIDFEKFSYYSEGKYHIGDKAYSVSKEWGRHK